MSAIRLEPALDPSAWLSLSRRGMAMAKGGRVRAPESR